MLGAWAKAQWPVRRTSATFDAVPVAGPDVPRGRQPDARLAVETAVCSESSGSAPRVCLRRENGCGHVCDSFSPETSSPALAAGSPAKRRLARC